MRKAACAVFVIVGLVLLSWASVAPAKARTESKFVIPAEVLCKLQENMVIELSKATDNSTVDAIVACNRAVYSQYLRMVQDAVGELRITQEWSPYPIFRAQLSRSQVCALGKLPFVTRIDNNTWSYGLCMDAARLYTHVDYIRSLYPYLDGGFQSDGTDVVIAIIDTGIDVGHHDLDNMSGGRPKVVSWVDLIGNAAGQKLVYPYDDMGHGTHCASIAAGTGDANPNYRGVAPAAALVGIKAFNWLGMTSEAILLDALSWVASQS